MAGTLIMHAWMLVCQSHLLHCDCTVEHRLQPLHASPWHARAGCTIGCGWEHLQPTFIKQQFSLILKVSAACTDYSDSDFPAVTESVSKISQMEIIRSSPWMGRSSVLSFVVCFLCICVRKGCWQQLSIILQRTPPISFVCASAFCSIMSEERC